MAPHEELFQRLHSRAEITALIGQTENLHLDCKTWSWPLPSNDQEGQRILAKAFSGFANADGGVVLVGMATDPAQKYDPDVITGERPVTNAIALKARIEALVGELVVPLLGGVRLAAVPNQTGSNAGFVLVHVPPTDGFPVQSRKDAHFYMRSASGTYRMEYFQIADMFGRRRRPSLALYLGEQETGPRRTASGVLLIERSMMLGLRNDGRGIARFPSIRVLAGGQLSVHEFGVDGNGSFGLNRLTADPNVIAFGGGADHVIHAGTVLKITKIGQRGRITPFQPSPIRKTYAFDAININVEMFAEDMESKTALIQLPEQEFVAL